MQWSNVDWLDIQASVKFWDDLAKRTFALRIGIVVGGLGNPVLVLHKYASLVQVQSPLIRERWWISIMLRLAGLSDLTCLFLRKLTCINNELHYHWQSHLSTWFERTRFWIVLWLLFTGRRHFYFAIAQNFNPLTLLNWKGIHVYIYTMKIYHYYYLQIISKLFLFLGLKYRLFQLICPQTWARS